MVIASVSWLYLLSPTSLVAIILSLYEVKGFSLRDCTARELSHIGQRPFPSQWCGLAVHVWASIYKCQGHNPLKPKGTCWQLQSFILKHLRQRGEDGNKIRNTSYQRAHIKTWLQHIYSWGGGKLWQGLQSNRAAQLIGKISIFNKI